MRGLKLFILLVIVFILGGATVVLIPPSFYENIPKISMPNKLSPSIQSCVLEWERKEIKSSSGGIIVQFQDNVNEEEALNVINSTGLEVIKSFYPSIKTVHVKVTEDKAFEWVCRLQENPKVRYTNPNTPNQAT